MIGNGIKTPSLLSSTKKLMKSLSFSSSITKKKLTIGINAVRIPLCHNNSMTFRSFYISIRSGWHKNKSPILTLSSGNEIQLNDYYICSFMVSLTVDDSSNNIPSSSMFTIKLKEIVGKSHPIICEKSFQENEIMSNINEQHQQNNNQDETKEQFQWIAIENCEISMFVSLT